MRSHNTLAASPVYNKSMIKVNLYATFRLHAGGIKSFSLDLPAGSTIRTAMDEIIARNPALHKDWLDENQQVHAHVIVILDGEDTANLPDGLNTQIVDGAQLELLPPVAGG